MKQFFLFFRYGLYAFLGMLLSIVLLSGCSFETKPCTEVSIEGDNFMINGELTYKGRVWNGVPIEGLLMNSRMVQGIFDDLNPETVSLFGYPDTQQWDAERNTDEFIQAMDSWLSHGMLAFTLCMQGGSPFGYKYKPVINSAFDEQGELRLEYMQRLERILDAADAKGMVVILGYFYFGQDEHLKDENAVLNAVDNITKWLVSKNYRNVLIEVANECNYGYHHDILKAPEIHRLIERIKQVSEQAGRRLLVGTSFTGRTMPTVEVADVSDFILLHGNGVDDPLVISQMVSEARALTAPVMKPVLFNEDDHFDFEKDTCNMTMAVRSHASWGYFDYRMEGESFQEGYQSVPVDWTISSDRKRGFFSKLKEITGF